MTQAAASTWRATPRAVRPHQIGAFDFHRAVRQWPRHENGEKHAVSAEEASRRPLRHGVFVCEPGPRAAPAPWVTLKLT